VLKNEVGGIIREKVQTSLWLDKDVKRLIEDENLNLTKWVNENVLISLALDTPEKVEVKIRLKESELEVLKKRLERLVAAKAEGGKEESTKKEALDALKEHFETRARREMSHSENLGWITAPKNLIRCKILERTPEDILGILEAWFDGTQTSK